MGSAAAAPPTDNSALVTTSLSRFLFKSEPGGRGWQQLEEEGKEEESPE